MDRIEVADFGKQFDAARLKNTSGAFPIRYSGHLLLPGDDVVIALTCDDDLTIEINGQLATRDHPVVALVEDHDTSIRRALKRSIGKTVLRSEIIGRWHENGDEYAFEPYLVRAIHRDKPDVLHKYRFRIFPLDGYKLGDDFSIDFTSADAGEKVKAVLETSTEMHIHFDDLPKSMFAWMPVGVVWSPPRKSGYPVLVEYAIGKKRRMEIRELASA